MKRALASLKLKLPGLAPRHLRKMLSVEGHITSSECLLLFNLASQVSSKCIVEIGSYRGRSTVCLALGSQMNNRPPVYAIEPHEQFTGPLGGEFGPRDRCAFFTNMTRKGVCEIVRLVNLSSDAVVKGWTREVALLWIDGDHRYDFVRRDFDCWEPFVIEEGVIALHDSIDPCLGPRRVVDEVLASGKFTLIQQADSTTVLRKQTKLLHSVGS
jgi:hypothetical protein